MDNRTIIRFHSSSDVSAVVDKWVVENGYRKKDSGGPEMMYQKGYGILMAPMMMAIKNDGQDTILEAWFKLDILTRLMTFFLLPNEMGIESGGYRLSLHRLVLSRSMALTATNKLLARLGQPPIN
jgi:hypothetical protein